MKIEDIDFNRNSNLPSSFGSWMIIFFLLFSQNIQAQVNFIEKANENVDLHQRRIDSLDGKIDNIVTLISDLQSTKATALYMAKVDKVQLNINQDDKLQSLDKKRLLTDLGNVLEEINASNYFMYNAFDRHFDMILNIQQETNVERIKTLLKSDMVTSLNIIPFFDFKPYAIEILKHAAQVEPSLLLTQYGEYGFHRYSKEVIEEVCKFAPMHISYYMGTNNPVFMAMYNDPSLPTIKLMMDIYNKVGSNSRAYLLLEPISKGRITAEKADLLGKDRDSLYRYLLKLRVQNPVLASYSIDDELTNISLLRIRQINELHEEKDAVRFKLCDSVPMSSADLYGMMVYGEDEIYTSTFLGLYERFIQRMEIKSSYEFLHTMGMNRYRTFVKMCAGYNTLPSFLERMSVWEKRSLFNRFTQSLQTEIDPLEQTVAVADTYGSLTNEEDKKIFELALKKEYELIRWSNKEAEKLYSILMSALGIESSGNTLKEDIVTSSNLKASTLFKNGEHIQQHFFFDDADGWASYATFISRFRKPGWTIKDHAHYVIIESTAGKKVKIYANKAKYEYDGQEELNALFKKTGRFPDVVVHRGHSYYAQTTIQSITPNSDLVILGSCGGYNNISKVLNYSPESQIITSKQVGTMAVNNELIFTICESLRLGKDLQWDVLWNQVGDTIKNDKVASDRFEDYLPPNKNMGAMLIRTYRKSI